MNENQLPAYLQSIFHPLFQHTTDLDSRLMLIEEMLAVGDEKEIPFLTELESHQDPRIVQKAQGIKKDLIKKLGKITEGERRRLPMNLCFIYEEFNLRPSKVDTDLDFEVALDILEH